MSLSRQLFLFLLISLISGCSSSDRDAISVDVSGTVRYEDKLYNDTGFIPMTAMKPVRHARVELVSDQGVIAETATDDSGYYSLKGRGSGLFVRVLSKTDGTISHGVEVVSVSNPSQLYAIRSRILNKNDADINLDFTLADAGPVTGVFNILDVYQNAGEFVANAAVWDGELPVLQARWAECNTNGTYTGKTTASSPIIIAVLGLHADCDILQSPLYRGSVDTDEYDDDVLWHEYGHYLEIALNTLDSPGVTHTITDTEQDLRLAWSEGWGNFLSGAIKQWLAATYPERLSIETALSIGETGFPTSLYVDTFGSKVFSYDFRSGTLLNTPLHYATNEGAIAKILWGINDDALFDFTTIWRVFANRLTVNDGSPSNLEKVWGGWLSEFGPSSGDKETMRTILRDREVYYEIDDSESDNSTTDAKPLRNADGDYYTLFFNDGKDQDHDLVSFNVIANNDYRIETYNLRNGADTYLRILDSLGDVVATNDNHKIISSIPPSPNDTCRFSSRVEFTATSDDTYYAEVTSINNWEATGDFGDYQLLISENPPPEQAVKCP